MAPLNFSLISFSRNQEKKPIRILEEWFLDGLNLLYKVSGPKWYKGWTILLWCAAQIPVSGPRFSVLQLLDSSQLSLPGIFLIRRELPYPRLDSLLGGSVHPVTGQCSGTNFRPGPLASICDL